MWVINHIDIIDTLINGDADMDRKEFLDILRGQLAGNMQEGKAAAHVRYYEDYIQSQVRGGRPEREVLEELGDPRLIAKTLIDTDDGSAQEDYGEYSSYGSSYGSKMDPPPQPEKKWKKVNRYCSRGCCYYSPCAVNWSCSSILYYSGNYSLFSFLVKET